MMIKVVIDKSRLTDAAQKAAFEIVKNSIELSLKALDKEVQKEGGKVEVKITGPGTLDVEMDGISLKLRKKISSVVKKISK